MCATPVITTSMTCLSGMKEAASSGLKEAASVAAATETATWNINRLE